MSYTKHYSTKKTPQSRKIPGSNQVKNSAGGYSFEVTPFQRLMRFLILGSENGSYYASAQQLTTENADGIVKLIQDPVQGLEVVEAAIAVSKEGRAPKNDPAIFVLALAATFGNVDVKTAAYAGVPQVCRIGTHLFTFLQYIKDLKGFGSGVKRAIAKYYNNKSTDRLALDILKYRQRNGWTHRDALRLAHIKPASAEQNDIFAYAAGKNESPENVLIQAFEKVQTLDASKKGDVKTAISLIRENNLPREFLPTQFLTQKEIWAALLPGMPITALVRNLGKMTSIGLLDSNLSSMVKVVKEKLIDKEAIKRSRIHPITLLQALAVYSSGGGYRGKLNWTPVKGIQEALNDAFYLSFGNVESTGKNLLLAVDCSGSMSSPVGGSDFLSCRNAAAAMSLITQKVESNTEIVGFSSGSSRSRFGGSGIAPLSISSRDSLEDVTNKMARFPWGGTDCTLPMLYAIEKGLHVDTFIVYTDSETWAGNVHPTQALAEYRKRFNPEAKLIVVGMNSNNFTIADPADGGMLDVVGFDTATPNIMAEFIKGNI